MPDAATCLKMASGEVLDEELHPVELLEHRLGLEDLHEHAPAEGIHRAAA
jgi:hypothetical protein